jgi:hypothetical protein
MPITPTNTSKNIITPVGATKSSLSTFANGSITANYLNTESGLRLICENSDYIILEGLSFIGTNISKS